MTENAWTNWHECAIKEAGPKVLETPTTPNRNPIYGGSGMAVNANISARGDSTSVDTKDTWKSIGELARKAAEKLGGGK